jgi:spore maturation protein CgeB
MHIFEVIEASSNSVLRANQVWHHNLYEPLLELGHNVLLFPSGQGWQAMWRHDTNLRSLFSQNLLDVFRREHSRQPFDMFFAYLMDGMVEPGVIDEIRKTGVPTCNFSCNNTHQFDLVDEISLHFDYNLHSEKDAAQKFKSIGANAVWFPMAANPRYYHPYDVPRTIDVSFVGQCYARRPYFIGHLLENQINVQVFGPGWKPKQDKLILRRPVRWARRTGLLIKAILARSAQTRYTISARVADLDRRGQLQEKYPSHLHPPVSDEEMIRTYSQSKISLGFLEVYDQHNPSALVKQHLHLREFEAPMSGALYLTGWCEELEDFYEPDVEILIYRNEHEMLDKVRHYLAHPEDAERVRQAGHQRAIREHTYHRRFELLFQQIGLVR